MKITPREKRRHAAWGDFHARSRFDRSTIPEEKWTTRRQNDGCILRLPKCIGQMTKRFFVLLLFFVMSLRTNRFLKFLSYGQSLVNFGES